MRQLCILDTNAVINLSRVDLVNRKLIRWITDIFEVYIPYKVWEEANEVFMRKRELAEARGMFLIEIKGNKIKREKVTDECYKIFDKEKEKRFKFEKIDPGEFHCAALAMNLSRIFAPKHVYLLTDDGKARPCLDIIFQKQQMGTILSSLDFLIYLYACYPRGIVHTFVEKAMWDLMPMHTRKKELTIPVPEVSEYPGLLKETCRFLCERMCGTYKVQQS